MKFSVDAFTGEFPILRASLSDGDVQISFVLSENEARRIAGDLLRASDRAAAVIRSDPRRANLGLDDEQAAFDEQQAALDDEEEEAK